MVIVSYDVVNLLLSQEYFIGKGIETKNLSDELNVNNSATFGVTKQVKRLNGTIWIYIALNI